MAILRKHKRNQYTVIDQAVFRDEDISYKAKGLLCQMLSLPDGWAFSIEGLVKMSLDGKSSVMSALNELEDAGYLYREQIKKDGRYAGMEYIVSEVRMTDFPNSENRNAEFRNSEIKTLSNTKVSNTNKSNTNLHTHKEQRPTIEEIRSYISEKNLNVDAEKFFDYFDAGEWLDSKGKPVRSWKQKLITWSNNNGNDTGTSRGIRSRVRDADGRSQGGDEQVQTGFIPDA